VELGGTQLGADGEAVVLVLAPEADPCPDTQHEPQLTRALTSGRDSMVAVAVMMMDCAWSGRDRPSIRAVRDAAGIEDDQHLSLEGVQVAANRISNARGRPIDIRRRSERPLEELWRHLASEQPVGLLINYDNVRKNDKDLHQLGSSAPTIHAVWVRYGREGEGDERTVLVYDPLAGTAIEWPWGFLRAAARSYLRNDAWSGVVLFGAPT
jgi:hypothetical protein